MATGRDYELIVKAIYEALWRQDRLDQWEVRHDVKVSGNKGKHQIDVYGKFRAAGEEHQIIIEVKGGEGRTREGGPSEV